MARQKPKASDILVMTVGRGQDTRRYETLYDSMKKSMGSGHWRRIVLLPSADTREIAQELIRHVNALRFDPLPVEIAESLGPGEHDDEDLCYAHFDRTLAGLIAEGEDAAHIVLDYTRGTKAMGAAAVLACISRGVDRIRYVTGKRGPDGMVIPGSETLYDGHTYTALFRRELDRARVLMQVGQFEQAKASLGALASVPGEPGAEEAGWKAALQELRGTLPATGASRSLKPHEREEVESGLALARFWGAWDRFYYLEAAQLVPKVTAVHPFWKGLEPDDVNLRMVAQLAQKVPARDPAKRSVQDYQNHARSLVEVQRKLAADLLENAWRRWWRGDYEDALIRAFRCQELMGHLRLCLHGILASDLCQDDPAVAEWLRTATFRGAPIRLYRNELPKPMVAALLRFLEDRWFQDRVSKEWESLRHRNQSPLTHGLSCQATRPKDLAKILKNLGATFKSENKGNAVLLAGARFPAPRIPERE